MIDRVTEPQAAHVAACWLGTLQQIADAAAHEVRNALNGVAVNVEVVRSRTQRDAVEAKSLAPFATHAAEQVELAVALSEALLRVTRPARVPLDLAQLVGDIRTLLEPATGRAGGRLNGDVRSLAPMACDGDMAEACRAVVGTVLLLAAQSGTAAGVRADGDARLVVETNGGAPLVLPAGVASLAQRAGIAVDSSDRQVTMTFSAAPR